MSDTTLRKLEEQVVVITGATSGIGLATAILASKRGAKVVIAARSDDAGTKIAAEINAQGGQALFVKCDVSNRQDVENLAAAAIAKFGRIDTWVNNAGLSIYGRLDEISEQDSRRLFDTNFWGVYYGSLIALPYLKRQGGALINLGSEVSETVVPLQGIYTVSKHAVKGFTDALRIEVEELEQAPISITLIQPTATDTPFPQHAKNYMPEEPKLPSPMDDPNDVADAILTAAVTPTRSKKVGLMSKVNTATANFAPKISDKIAAKIAGHQQYNEPPRHPEGSLEHASEEGGGAGHVYGLGGRTDK